MPLARLAIEGAVLRLGEDDLRFSDEELAGFAARQGIAIGRFDDTGGWPAMAELVASVGHDLAGDYLWEEVLEPLGPERRRVLAVLSDLGGADDGLAGAALGAPVDLARVLDGVPLAHGTGGWRVPHPLWHGVPALALANEERVSTRRRAVDHSVAEHRYDEAVTLAREAGLVDLVPGILRAACIGADRPPGRQLERWLADLPEAVRDTAGAALAAGVRAAVLAPAEATEPVDVLDAVELTEVLEFPVECLDILDVITLPACDRDHYNIEDPRADIDRLIHLLRHESNRPSTNVGASFRVHVRPRRAQ